MLSAKKILAAGPSGGSSTPRQSSSAVAIACNDDLLIEILLRLPIKPLLKFKSVSKHWLSIISNPHFSRRRSLYPAHISGLFLNKSLILDHPEYSFISLDGKPSTGPPLRLLNSVDDPARINILNSCNGLLCCGFGEEGSDLRVEEYCVYNPTTQQFSLLPQLGLPISEFVFGVGLAFDPCKSLHYKVLCVISSGLQRHRYRIEIYSSETHLWRQSGEPFAPRDDIDFDHGAFWNGAIHWISDLGTALRFDVNQEQLQEMAMPEIPDNWHRKRIKYFGECRDHLHLILTKGTSYTQFDVYEMEKDYSRWFVKYQVNFDEVNATAFPAVRRKNYYARSIHCLVREENDQDSFLVLHIPGKVLCYSFKNKTLKKLCDLALDGTRSITLGWQNAYQFAETLRFCFIIHLDIY